MFELNPDGEVVGEWHVLGERLWQCFSKGTDYGKINLKPHESHPNSIFFLDEEMRVTRFYQRDAISLRDPARRIPITAGAPHDGHVYGDHIFFTTTNGNIVIANRHTSNIDEIIDLNAIHSHGGPLGWSRGLCVTGEVIWVGFSRIRPTKFKENVDWVKHSLKWRLRGLLPGVYTRRSKWMKKGLKKELPMRIACYDPKKKKLSSRNES